MNVPLLDLKPQYEEAREAIHEALDRVVQSNRFILGPEVERAEAHLAQFCGCAHGVGVSSGTDALLVSLMALGVGPGQEVITTAYSFFATAGVIARLGAIPVFVDVDPQTFNLDPHQVAARVTPQTRAILPVHLYGQPASMDELMEVSAAHDLPVVEDAAQAIGAQWKGNPAGSLGYTGCFSFFPSKNLGCMGDGGLVTTQNPEIASRIRSLRTHGSSDRYLHLQVGGNFRLDAMQAAILLAKLPYLESWNQRRHQNAQRYDRLFRSSGLAAPEGTLTHTPSADHPVVVPVRHRDASHVFNQYVIRANDRDHLQRHLKAAGVGTAVYYPLPLHLQPCFAGLGYKPGDLPHAEQAAKETLALPIYSHLEPTQIDHVVQDIVQYYHK